MSLEFSNNLIEFRTCVDTCAALRDLMQYIASYGDLRDFAFVKAKSFDSCVDETDSVDGFSTPLGSLVRKNINCRYVNAVYIGFHGHVRNVIHCVLLIFL